MSSRQISLSLGGSVYDVASEARSARCTPLGVSTPTNLAPSLTPTIARSSRNMVASASSNEESRSIAAASSPALTPSSGATP